MPNPVVAGTLAALGAKAAWSAGEIGAKGAYSVGKKIVKKVRKKLPGKKVVKAALKEVEKGAAVDKTKWGIDKGAVNMVKGGKIKEHGGQEGAYKPAGLAGEKKNAFASNLERYAQKKILAEPRALTYSKEASMKTRR